MGAKGGDKGVHSAIRLWVRNYGVEASKFRASRFARMLQVQNAHGLQRLRLSISLTCLANG